MARERTQQSRARLGPDSYQRSDGIARWRSVMSIAMPLIVLVLFVVAPAWNGGPALSRWGRFASPGPLVRSHAVWESKCDVCHLPFTSVDRSKVSDQKCQICHDGPPHHTSALTTGVPPCGSCHSDHRGRETSLARMDDSSCIQCHGALTTFRMGDAGPLTFAASVTRFDGNPAHHPEFRWLSNVLMGDPGQVIFNHKLHLAHGLTSGPEVKPFTFAQLPEAARKRYGWKQHQDVNSAVQLACASCHLLDSEEFRATSGLAGSWPIGSAGAYMLPVSYANNCRDCHPLPFDPKLPEREVRHGVQPPGVLDQLRTLYAAQAVETNPRLLGRPIPRQSLPDRPLDRDVQTAQQAVEEKVLTALRVLFQSEKRGCTECHKLSNKLDPLIDSKQLEKATIPRANIPRIWFEHAHFDHSAHRAIDCLSCHENATKSRVSSDILLPGMKTCVKCHGRLRSQGAVVSGGAEDACTECHGYHNCDQSQQGLGASDRAVSQRHNIEEFLRGTIPAGRR
jgi:hypothetical protein